jgi:hypothetical protein
MIGKTRDYSDRSYGGERRVLDRVRATASGGKGRSPDRAARAPSCATLRRRVAYLSDIENITLLLRSDEGDPELARRGAPEARGSPCCSGSGCRSCCSGRGRAASCRGRSLRPNARGAGDPARETCLAGVHCLLGRPIRLGTCIRLPNPDRAAGTEQQSALSAARLAAEV